MTTITSLVKYEIENYLYLRIRAYVHQYLYFELAVPMALTVFLSLLLLLDYRS